MKFCFIQYTDYSLFSLMGVMNEKIKMADFVVLPFFIPGSRSAGICKPDDTHNDRGIYNTKWESRG